jgi:hypothetical protein
MSGIPCQACCLVLVARAFQVRGNAQKPRVHFNGLNSKLTKSVVIMAHDPGAVVQRFGGTH